MISNTFFGKMIVNTGQTCMPGVDRRAAALG
jgi:hypothetical protein